MKKLCFLSVLTACLIWLSPLFADTQPNQSSPAAEQARRDYRAYLQQLKQLNTQYKEVMGEITKIIREEGLPTWDSGFENPAIWPNKTTSSAVTGFGQVDLKEMDGEMVVKADLPGLQKDEIKVSIEENKMLHISGKREAEKEETKTTPEARYYKAERQRGSFERVIELPAPARDNGIEARYENGVLTIRIPKVPISKKEVSVPVR